MTLFLPLPAGNPQRIPVYRYRPSILQKKVKGRNIAGQTNNARNLSTPYGVFLWKMPHNAVLFGEMNPEQVVEYKSMNLKNRMLKQIKLLKMPPKDYIFPC